MHILLIGGTGVLSSAICNEALRQGIEVTMINRGRRKIAEGAILIKSDRKDYENIETQLQGKQFDAIFDFLCYTDTDTTESFKMYSKYTQQYFFISSCAVYNKTVSGIKIEDSPKVTEIWPYSVNKWKSEKHLIEMAVNSKCNYTIIRPCVTYDDTRIPYGIMPQYGYHWTLVARILAGKPVIRWDKGKTKSNMMRVEDFAAGAVGLIGNIKSYNEAFNICGDESPSFNDVLSVLSELLGKEIKFVDLPNEFYAAEVPSRRGEILGARSMDAINSNTKIKSIVPLFQQTILLKEGISMTLNAYKNKHYQHGIDWKFDADTDRIIQKWCKSQGINTKNMNLGFVDYLGTATNKNRFQYWLEYNKANFLIKLVLKGIEISQKAIKTFLSFI